MKQKKEKTKLFDATVRRLITEAKPIRWWILLSCLMFAVSPVSSATFSLST